MIALEMSNPCHKCESVVGKTSIDLHVAMLLINVYYIYNMRYNLQLQSEQEYINPSIVLDFKQCFDTDSDNLQTR